MTRASQALGRFGEDVVTRWYQQRGWTVVERNFRCARGEVDIIAQLGTTVVFCEVKTRTSARFGDGAEAVGYRRQQRLRAAAVVWLLAQELSLRSLRFDVACVSHGKVTMLEGAF